MSIGRTNASSGGKGPLTISIKPFSTNQELLASTPKEYTIGIVTTVPITEWIMNAKQGVWGKTAGSVNITFESTSTYDDATLNTRLLKGKLNGLYGEAWIKLTGCYQSDGEKNVAVSAYIYKRGSWIQFSAAFESTVNITYPAGSVCTATDGTITFTAPNTSGSWTCKVPNAGTWTITSTDGASTASTSVSITAAGQTASATLAYTGVPTFTYTGSYQIVSDTGSALAMGDTTTNWNIRFLTSGTLRFSNLKGAGGGIDIFCVGGGGGGGSSGGCGGRTSTSKSSISANTNYAVTIGAGGSSGGGGGGSSSFGSIASANGGGGPGGAGGSGGGGSGLYITSSNKANGGNGGSDGSNGTNGYGTDGFRNGSGQGSTTRAFGSSNGTLYAGGGGGAGDYNCSAGTGGSGGGGAGGSIHDSNPKAGGNGTANTGGGGGGGSPGGSGGSGIIIIRNKR